MLKAAASLMVVVQAVRWVRFVVTFRALETADLERIVDFCMAPLVAEVKVRRNRLVLPQMCADRHILENLPLVIVVLVVALVEVEAVGSEVVGKIRALTSRTTAIANSLNDADLFTNKPSIYAKISKKVR